MRIFLRDNDEQTGPHGEAEVRAMVAAGEVSRKCLAWADGQSAWTPLATVIELPPEKPVALPAGLPPIPPMRSSPPVMSPSVETAPTPATPPTPAQTFIIKDNQQLGPFRDSEVLAGLSTGAYSAQDLAWREGMPEWKPLQTLYPSTLPPVPVVETAVSAEIEFGAQTKSFRLAPDSFGSFGFVGSGKIVVTPNQIQISGPKLNLWTPFLVVIISFFLIGLFIVAVSSPAFTRLGQGWILYFLALLPFLAARMACEKLAEKLLNQPGTATFRREDVSDVGRTKNTLSMVVRVKGNDAAKRVIFNFASEEKCTEIEIALRS